MTEFTDLNITVMTSSQRIPPNLCIDLETNTFGYGLWSKFIYSQNIVSYCNKTLYLMLPGTEPWSKDPPPPSYMTFLLRGNECLLVDKWTKWKKNWWFFFQSTAIIFSKFDWYHDNRQWFWCMYPVKLYQNLLLKMMARRTKCNNVLEI